MVFFNKGILNGRGYIHGCRVGVHVSKWLFTRQPFKILSQIGYIHGCRVSTYYCYLHGSRSRANSDYIHGCRVSTLNRYLHGSHSSAKSAIYIAAGCIQKSLFTRQPFKSQIGYIHCCRVYTKIVIYTARIQEPNRLYTLLPRVYIDCYLHGSHSRANSALYIAAGCIYMKLLFNQQPFKSQIDCATTAQLIGAFVFTYVKS